MLLLGAGSFHRCSKIPNGRRRVHERQSHNKRWAYLTTSNNIKNVLFGNDRLTLFAFISQNIRVSQSFLNHQNTILACFAVHLRYRGHGLFVALWPPNFKWTSTTVTRYIDACFRLSTSSQNTPFHLLLTVFCAKLQMQMRKIFFTAPQRSMNGHEYGKAGNSKTQAYRQL